MSMLERLDRAIDAARGHGYEVDAIHLTTADLRALTREMVAHKSGGRPFGMSMQRYDACRQMHQPHDTLRPAGLFYSKGAGPDPSPDGGR